MAGHEEEDYARGRDAYLNGDNAEALRLWVPLAEKGDASVQTILGEMYEMGVRVPQDYSQAVFWYRQAAEQGNTLAQINLGTIYYEGKGLPQDYSQAVFWYRKAAEQGLTRAQVSLGFMYGIGQGVPQDFVLAHMWSNLAAAKGNDLGRENRDVYAGQMTPSQIEEAQRLAREWFAKHQ